MKEIASFVQTQLRLMQKGLSLRLIWTIIFLGTGAAMCCAYGQGSIPAIRGYYQGTYVTTTDCPAGGGEGQITVSITSQVSDNFSGQIPTSGPTIFLTGTVDSNGQLQGTYEYSASGVAAAGTFTGQFNGSVVPKVLDLTLTGTVTFSGLGPCDQTTTIMASLLTSSAASADLSITGSASPTPVATGKSISYTLTISNAGPNDATATLAVNPAPLGTSILSATSSQGQCSATPGNAACSLGTVPNGGSATITVTAVVFEPAGSTVVDSPSVSSDVFDPNFSNNSTTISTRVDGGALVKLKWNQPQSTGAGSTPAPTDLNVQPAGPLPSTSASVLGSSASTTGTDSRSSSASGSTSANLIPMDSCTQTGVNVYKADQPNVQPIPANLFSSLAAAALEATVPVAPSGSSYVVTSSWQCGTTVMESGISNEVDVRPGPTITGLKVTGKLKVLGSGFSGQVQIFVDGVGFIKAAILADFTLLIQKGALSDGTSIADIGTTKAVLVTVKNGDGGFATFTFKRP